MGLFFYTKKGSIISTVDLPTTEIIEPEKIDTKSIFKYGQSSKGQERGIGLANVKEILGKYPHISLMTSSSNYRFRQELHILEKKGNSI